MLLLPSSLSLFLLVKALFCFRFDRSSHVIFYFLIRFYNSMYACENWATNILTYAQSYRNERIFDEFWDIRFVRIFYLSILTWFPSVDNADKISHWIISMHPNLKWRRKSITKLCWMYTKSYWGESNTIHIIIKMKFIFIVRPDNLNWAYNEISRITFCTF